MNMKHIVIRGLILSALFVGFTSVNAATTASIEIPPGTASSTPAARGAALAQADGQTSCFDLYRFGSVQVTIGSPVGTAISGASVPFTAAIRNQNSYPVVGGAVYVKVFKLQSSASNNHANGGDLVDQFYAAKGIDLAANGSRAVSFSWNAPAYALSGDYEIVPYFIVDGKFNLEGLSFTDDIHGKAYDFSLKGDSTGGVAFDKNSVTVDGGAYLFASFTPKVDKDKPIVVSAKLMNSTSRTQTATIIAHIYRWDAATPENELRRIPLSVTLAAGETKAISFTVTEKAPVILAVIEADYRDAKSILDVRFTREGLSYPRINFPAVTTYPIRAGEPATFFSCVHAAGTLDSIPDGRVVLSLLDPSGNVLSSYSYQGAITGAMMGFKKTFTPSAYLADFKLRADVYQGASLIDTATIAYSCSAIDPTLCPEAVRWDVGNPYVVPIASLAIAVVLAVYLLHRKKRVSQNIAALLIIVVGAMGFGGVSTLTRAAISTYAAITVPPNGTTWTAQFDPGVNYMYVNRYEADLGVPAAFAGNVSLGPISVSVAYGGTMTNADTGANIASGDSVPVGARVAFAAAPFANSNISWFSTGYTNDSPYGYWSSQGVPLCNQSDFVSGIPEDVASTPGDTVKPNSVSASCISTKTLGGVTVELNTCNDAYYRIYAPLSVDEPAVSVDTSGSTAGLTKNSDGTYTVTGPGTINARISFASTGGRVANQQTVSKNVNWPPGACTVVNASYYPFTVPAQSINLTATAVSPCDQTQAPTTASTASTPTWGPENFYCGDKPTGTYTSTCSSASDVGKIYTYNPFSAGGLCGASTAGGYYKVCTAGTSGTSGTQTPAVKSGCSPSTTAITPPTISGPQKVMAQDVNTYTVSGGQVQAGDTLAYQLSFDAANPKPEITISPAIALDPGSSFFEKVLAATAGSATFQKGWSTAGQKVILARTVDQTIAAQRPNVDAGASTWTAPFTVTVAGAPVDTATNATVSIQLSGTGSGTVTSDVGGANCSTQNPQGCTITVLDGTRVTLTAAAAAGSTFSGWNGICSGTGTCSVTATGSNTVVAAFDQPAVVTGPIAVTLVLSKTSVVPGEAILARSVASGAGVYNHGLEARYSSSGSASAYGSWQNWGVWCQNDPNCATNVARTQMPGFTQQGTYELRAYAAGADGVATYSPSAFVSSAAPAVTNVNTSTANNTSASTNTNTSANPGATCSVSKAADGVLSLSLAGNTATISWNNPGGFCGSANPNWMGAQSNSPSGSVTTTVSQSTAWSATCVSSGWPPAVSAPSVSVTCTSASSAALQAPQPGFTISADPATVRAKSLAGFSGITDQVIHISVNPVSGFSSPVVITVDQSSLPAGVSPEFSFDGGTTYSTNPAATLSFDGQFYRAGSLISLPVVVRFKGTLGKTTYPITFIGTGGGKVSTTTVNVDSKPLYPGFQEI